MKILKLSIIALSFFVVSCNTAKKKQDQTVEEKGENKKEQVAKEVSNEKSTESSNAIDFTLKDLNNNDFSISSLKGKYVLLDFWAYWCGPCLKGIPSIKEFHNQYNSKGLEIVSIHVDPKVENWKAMVKKMGMNWNNVIDAQGEASRMFNVRSIPRFVLLDKKGEVMVDGLREHELAEKFKEIFKN